MGVTDALTRPDWWRFEDARIADSDCKYCGAPWEATHTQTCVLTPIYARLVPSEMNMIIGSFHAANTSLTQTVIRCAICGREGLGRNMLVVRDQAQVGVPGKIVKAVCPSHNRTCTQPAQQRLERTGYEWR